MTVAACSGSRIRLQPALCFAIFGTGQPMFTSTMSAPMPFDDLRRRRHLGRIAAENLDRDRSFFLRVFRVLQRAIDTADEPLGRDHLRHDEATAPVPLDQPAKRRVGHAGHRRHDERRRKRDVADLHCALRESPHCILTLHFNFTSVGPDVRRVDFDTDRLTNQIDRQHQPRLVVLPQQPADDAAERPVDHFDHHAFMNHRTGIEREIAFDELADAVDFVLGNRRRLALDEMMLTTPVHFSTGSRSRGLNRAKQ